MAKTKPGKRTTKSKKDMSPDDEVTIDRRRSDRRQKASTEKEKAENETTSETKPVTSERRKVPRRRQIDPTTCERDYTNDEIEFMHALDAYKRSSGRMFPTCSEILEVVRNLGYVRVSPEPLAQAIPPELSAAPNDDVSSDDTFMESDLQ